jgi:Ca2+-transporting ATPase
VSTDPPAGLTRAEARRRLAESGPNEIPQRGATSALRLAFAQIASPLVLLLLASGLVAFAVGEWIDATAICVIVAINSLVGFAQEYRAERAVLALRSLTARRASVVRDGHVVVIPAAEIVVGDHLVLEAGDIVGADARLVQAHHLSVNEAPLTGESMPVDKRLEPTGPQTPLAERSDWVFSGTSVATGTGHALVQRTGRATELGKIAGMLDDGTTSTTGLQLQLASLGRILVVGCIAGVAIVAGLGALRGIGALPLLLTSVSLAVAAIPEGLPAVVTVSLAVGVRRMTRQGILVRRLSAVESLGRATVICTDKTGTLTTGRMAARRIWGDETRTLATAAACCDAALEGEQATGDPTEIAILQAALEHGIARPQIERDNPRVEVVPFDTAARRMTIRRADGRRYVKGAAESLLPDCADVPASAEAEVDVMADAALRVLAVAVSDGDDEDVLRFVGLIGLADAPRPEAIAAIAAARRAGVRVVMITGDHPRTAHAIAREVGLAANDADAALRVHARATAADKTQIVRTLRAAGEIVAMTGDGVNDAPSIREADIGVAMGTSATEVTREAAELILTDDDLGGLLAAIREGRIIYGNVRKTIVYLLGGNVAELVLMMVAVALAMPLPLLPLQLLWINLVGEPLPGLLLAIDPPSRDVLAEPPPPATEPLVRRREWVEIGTMAVGQALVALGVYAWALGVGDVTYARTVTFLALVFGIVLRALASRDVQRLVPESDPRSNLGLWAVVVAAMLATAGLTELSATRHIFGLSALHLVDYGIALAAGLVPITGVEVVKLITRARNHARPPSAEP